jgi:hypothetical protein
MDEVKPVVKKAVPVRTVRRRVYTPPPFEVEIIRGERDPKKFTFPTAN